MAHPYLKILEKCHFAVEAFHDQPCLRVPTWLPPPLLAPFPALPFTFAITTILHAVCVCVCVCVCVYKSKVLSYTEREIPKGRSLKIFHLLLYLHYLELPQNRYLLNC